MDITTGVILDLKSKVNILELAREVTDMQPIASDYVGRCPFHNTDQPTFYVYPATGRSVCYTCGGGGDAFSFTAQLRNTSIAKAIEFLITKYQLSE